MAMRVTQGMMYSSYTSNINSTLADLMVTSEQSTTQKRINRPSDDPAGMANVLLYRQSLDNITQYKANCGTAEGWLGMADATLLDVQTLLSEIKTLAEQAATETLTAENREQISSQIRQHFETMLQYANVSFNGQYIFGGTNTQQQPYQMALYAHSNDPALANADFVVSGSADHTVVVQITEFNKDDVPQTFAYSYSEDGGNTWIECDNPAQIQNGALTLQCGAAQVVIAENDALDTSTTPPTSKLQANPIPAEGKDTSNWIYIRPTAVYSGNANTPTVVQNYSNGAGANLSPNAVGSFSRDVAVRIDGYDGTDLTYSYSVDNGSNWVSVTVPAGTDMLPIPGGFLKIDSSSLSPANIGDQFNVCPSRADINMEIGVGQTVTLNNVGSDIFGGLVDGQPVNGGDSSNMFEVLGRLIAGLETDDTDAIGNALEELNDVMSVVLSKAAEVGGRENRVTAAYENLIWRELEETDAMSAVEDINYIDLLTKLEKQQLAYNSVLKASSMLMQLSLLNYM